MSKQNKLISAIPPVTVSLMPILIGFSINAWSTGNDLNKARAAASPSKAIELKMPASWVENLPACQEQFKIKVGAEITTDKANKVISCSEEKARVVTVKEAIKHAQETGVFGTIYLKPGLENH